MFVCVVELRAVGAEHKTDTQTNFCTFELPLRAPTDGMLTELVAAVSSDAQHRCVQPLLHTVTRAVFSFTSPWPLTQRTRMALQCDDDGRRVVSCTARGLSVLPTSHSCSCTCTLTHTTRSLTGCGHLSLLCHMLYSLTAGTAGSSRRRELLWISGPFAMTTQICSHKVFLHTATVAPPPLARLRHHFLASASSADRELVLHIVRSRLDRARRPTVTAHTSSRRAHITLTHSTQNRYVLPNPPSIARPLRQASSARVCLRRRAVFWRSCVAFLRMRSSSSSLHHLRRQ